MPDPSVPPSWVGAGRLFEHHDRLRQHLGGGAINWFLRFDHQVDLLHGDPAWPAAHFETQLSRVVDSGDELGTHPHNWRWDGLRWFPDGGDEWVVENAECALVTYAEVFGSGPPSFRYGERVVSDTVTRLLVDHPDVRVDLTTEPGTRACRGVLEPSTGITRHVDVNLARRYRPDRGSVDIPSDSGDLTIVPLTVAAIPGFGTIDTLVLWLEPAVFQAMLRVRLLDRDLDHLAFAIRSDIATRRADMEHLEANLRTLSACIDDLEWVNASAMALRADEPSAQGLGPVGALATEIHEVIRVVHPDPPVVVPPLAETVAELVERLAAIEGTVLWRLRTASLPILRPLARARRAMMQCWSSGAARTAGSPGGDPSRYPAARGTVRSFVPSFAQRRRS